MPQVVIADLMNRSVVSTTADTKLPEVVHLMDQYKVSCVLVVEENRPIGIVTERDLVRMLGQFIDKQCSKMTPVQDFMTTSLTVVKQTTTILDALIVAQSQSIRHLPVVDDNGFLCGILSYTDLARAYERIIEIQRKAIKKEMGLETQQLREVNSQLKALSMEDALLGIGNRRSMEVDLTFTHNTAMRYKRSYALVLFDVDCFKQYNDQYGHQAGDDALKMVAEHIRCEIRKADRLYRYGGEEFLLLLPETQQAGAYITAKRIVHNLAERNIPHAKSPFGVLTMSGGVASTVEFPVEKDWKGIMNLTDRRLYWAKRNGRNQVSGDKAQDRISEAK
jgi:diguanylate cyclase (GGDEF)-like protein